MGVTTMIKEMPSHARNAELSRTVLDPEASETISVVRSNGVCGLHLSEHSLSDLLKPLLFE
jgi:hypothetical protein